MNQIQKTKTGDSARAMLFHGAGRPLEAVTYPLPEPAAGELLVEVICCTLCQSDVHSFAGRRHVPLPSILGHEILGRVARLPRDQEVQDYDKQPLRVGDRVTWSVAAACGSCFFCDHGLPQKCEHLFKYGHESTSSENPLSGGLAEYCRLAPGTAVFRVPDAVADLAVTPANCATATVAAALRAAGGVADAVVVVQGAGMLGLTACAMAREAGAREVIACDVKPKRLLRAERFGAGRKVLVDPSQDSGELRHAVDEVTDRRGADVVLELSGDSHAAETGCRLARIGGTCVWVGAVFPGPKISLSPEMVIRRLLTIRGVHNYGPEDLKAALEFLERAGSKYPFESLVERTFPLSEAQTAFDYAAKGTALRVAVVPDG